MGLFIALDMRYDARGPSVLDRDPETIAAGVQELFGLREQGQQGFKLPEP